MEKIYVTTENKNGKKTKGEEFYCPDELMDVFNNFAKNPLVTLVFGYQRSCEKRMLIKYNKKSPFMGWMIRKVFEHFIREKINTYNDENKKLK